MARFGLIEDGNETQRFCIDIAERVEAEIRRAHGADRKAFEAMLTLIAEGKQTAEDVRSELLRSGSPVKAFRNLEK